MMPGYPEALHKAVVQRYAGCGRYARGFVHHKLRLDPVFYALLRHGYLPERGRLFDLGCGYGILPALIAAAGESYVRGDWPPGWPPPPRHLDLHGVDMSHRRLRVARAALGSAAHFEQADLRTIRIQSCSVIVMLDVMLYLEPEEQERLLKAAATALDPGGLLLMREADAAAGAAFRFTQWAERVVALFRGSSPWRLYYRSVADWTDLLQSAGFQCKEKP